MQLHGLRGWRPLNGRPDCVRLLIIGQPVVAGLAYTAYRPYVSSVCDMTSASAVVVCGLRHYTSVICLCLCLWI